MGAFDTALAAALVSGSNITGTNHDRTIDSVVRNQLGISQKPKPGLTAVPETTTATSNNKRPANAWAVLDELAKSITPEPIKKAFRPIPSKPVTRIEPPGKSVA